MFNTERTFGIEIEFIGDAIEVETAVRAAGVSCHREGYNHNTRSYWKITTDASVYQNRSYDNTGWELVSPILKGQEGLDELEKVCKALVTAGVKVNKTCGLHVHHGAGDFTTDTFKNIIKIYSRFEDTIDSLVSPSRRGTSNSYCRSLNDPTNNHYGYSIPEALERNTVRAMLQEVPDRYRKLNLQSYLTHGTVEFRQHQGSTDFTKISNWIKLTQAMVERAVARPVIGGRTNTWERFKKFLVIQGGNGNYISKRDDEAKELFKFFDKRKKQLAA